MAATFTVAGGRITPGIQTKDGVIAVGGSGRGERFVRVPAPPGSHVENDVVKTVPGYGALVLIRDHSGYRGGWRLTAPRTHEEWNRWIAGESAESIERRPHGAKVVAEGFCAQGAAGRMGGGPEYLVVMLPGESVEIVRSGRLYGAPATIRVDALEDGSVTVTDARAEVEEKIAAAALAAALGG